MMKDGRLYIRERGAPALHDTTAELGRHVPGGNVDGVGAMGCGTPLPVAHCRESMGRRVRQPMAPEALESRQLFAVSPGFIESEFAGGLSQPTAFALALDGRFFVAQQTGELQVIKDAALLPQPALVLDVDPQGERGLIGVTLDPAFADNGHLYVYYTTETPAVHNRVSRFTVVGDTIEPLTEQVVIDMPDLSGASNHNGGAIHFGTDGKLYIAVGDNANAAQSQALTTVFGKILRINADGTIPNDNPFLAKTTGQNQAIWARGLRNPYTFAVRSDGRIHINDVGQSAFEEINRGKPGANYGWPLIEGKRTSGQDAPPRYVDPLFAYDRSGGPVSGSVISGGAFYEASVGATDKFPKSFDGDYLFSDFGTGFVKSIDVATRKVSPIATALASPVDITVGSDGAIYVLEYFGGRVTRIVTSPPDLAVTMTREPRASQAAAGQRERVRLRIQNISQVPARGLVTIRLLASADDVVDGGDIVLKTAERRLSPGGDSRREPILRFAYPSGLPTHFRVLGEVLPTDFIDSDLASNVIASIITISATAS